MRLPFELVVFDLETNGATEEDPTAHRIVEIGAVKMNEELTIVGEFSMLVDGRPVTQEVIDIHGITNEMLDGKPKFAQVHEDFEEFCGKKQDYLLSGWGLYFDIPILRSEYQRIKKKFPHRGEGWDAKGSAWMDLLKNNKPVRHLNLKQAASLYGIPFEGQAHRAVDDARVTARILQKISGKRSASQGVGT